MDTTRGAGRPPMAARGRAAAALAAAVLGLGLAGCGGESELELASASQGNEARGSGVVAEGAAVAGAQVEIRCAGGAPLTVTADAGGAFSFPADKQVLPCVLRASGGQVGAQAQAQALHSVVHSFGRVNVTPLTDLLVARLGAEDPAVFYDRFPADNRATKIGADTAAAASAELKQWLSALGVDLGAGGFDPVGGDFTPVAGDAHVAVLQAYAARLQANAMTQSGARAAVAAFALPGPCAAATGFCWPVTSYKALAQNRVNEKGEPEAKFHEHDVDIAIAADGSWTKTVTLKSDKVGKIANFDVDVAGRGLAFTGKYRSADTAGDCGYALPGSEKCFEAAAAALLMVCGAGAGDDFVLLPYATVQKDSADEVKKEAATALHGQTFDRIVGCARTATTFSVSASGQVSDGSDASVTGAIAGHIGKDWSAKKIERKFWKVTSGTQTRYVGVESGSKGGQSHFVVLVSQ